MADNRSLDLVSWRPGPTRAALETFIAESVAAFAPEQRVAVFDNDGTLWCEKPMYAQMLIDHDDAEREFAYEGTAATFESSEPSSDTATRLGRTTVSMRRDWDRIFPAQ